MISLVIDREKMDLLLIIGTKNAKVWKLKWQAQQISLGQFPLNFTLRYKDEKAAKYRYVLLVLQIDTHLQDHLVSILQL